MNSHCVCFQACILRPLFLPGCRFFTDFFFQMCGSPQKQVILISDAFHGAGLREVVDRQHLFSLYVHLPPNKTLAGPPSIFHGREIPGSIPTGWGEWSLANASRVLLRRGPTFPHLPGSCSAAPFPLSYLSMPSKGSLTVVREHARAERLDDNLQHSMQCSAGQAERRLRGAR